MEQRIKRQDNFEGNFPLADLKLDHTGDSYKELIG
jgi:hypothetical protein